MGWDSSYFTTKNAMERKRDIGRNTKTLHIVTDLLELPMIQQNMVNTVVYNATTETICSYCTQRNHTIER